MIAPVARLIEYAQEGIHLQGTHTLSLPSPLGKTLWFSNNMLIDSFGGEVRGGDQVSLGRVIARNKYTVAHLSVRGASVPGTS